MLYESPFMTRLSRLLLAALSCIGCGLAAVAHAQPVPGDDAPAPPVDPTATAPATAAPATAAPPGTAAPDAYAPKPDESAVPAEVPGYGGPRPPPRKEKLEPNKTATVDDKREPQDFDGRAEVTSAGEDALWIPRVLFFPIYVVTEYIVRIPLGALTVAVEENNVIKEVQNLLSFGPDDNITITPSAFIDFGFRPSIGALLAWNDFLAKGNDLRIAGAFGGILFGKGSIANRIPITLPEGLDRSRSYIQLEADILTRADLLFWGIGPDSKEDGESGYGLFTYGGGARVHVEPWRGTFFEGWVTGRSAKTFAGECAGTSVVEEDYIARVCGTETIRRQVADGTFPMPPGFGRPYTLVKSGLRVALDSRQPRPAPGSGVAIDVNGELVSDIDEPGLHSWVNWGGAVAGFVDLTGTQRVLGLTIAARFQDKLTDTTVVPFTELVGSKRVDDVPDYDLMRGFKPGRLLGSSGIAATLDYRWPVWAFIDGTLQASVGNTFEEAHLEDFDPELMRFSFIGGIRTPNHRDHSFNLLVGFGTNTFADGGAPSSLRFVLGGTTGF
jgi:hypothetical protein